VEAAAVRRVGQARQVPRRSVGQPAGAAQLVWRWCAAQQWTRAMRQWVEPGPVQKKIQKIKVSGKSRAGRGLGERKGGFVEHNVAGDDDTIGGDIKTAVAFVFRRVTMEDTHGGAGSEFMGGSGRYVGIALTAKDTEMVVRWGRPKSAWWGVE
jgi:hypothetical protein